MDVTTILEEATGGSREATERLAALVYAELRERARQLLGRERPDHTLQPTELVHEAYLRLVDQTRCRWQNRAHFLAVASQAMRRILVDHARRRAADKRGGGVRKISLDEFPDLGTDESDTVLTALDVALDRLALLRPDVARVVEMKFFGGLTREECAEILGTSVRTVARHWDYAQVWLYREMGGGAGGGVRGPGDP